MYNNRCRVMVNSVKDMVALLELQFPSYFLVLGPLFMLN